MNSPEKCSSKQIADNLRRNIVYSLLSTRLVSSSRPEMTELRRKQKSRLNERSFPMTDYEQVSNDKERKRFALCLLLSSLPLRDHFRRLSSILELHENTLKSLLKWNYVYGEVSVQTL